MWLPESWQKTCYLRHTGTLRTPRWIIVSQSSATSTFASAVDGIGLPGALLPPGRCLQVWFWRFRAEHRQTVYQRMAVQQERQKVVDAMNRDRDRLVSSAKASLGLWSDAGVGETRRMFW